MSTPATGQVEYGTTAALGSTTVAATDYYTRHVQTIGGVNNPPPLTPGTLYYFRVKSVTAGGLTLYSDIDTFSTVGSSVTTSGTRPAPAYPTGTAVKIIGTHTAAVDDSGNTDVTAALQNILDSMNVGDVLVFAQSDPSGHDWATDAPISTYRISGPLAIRQDGVTLWGYGTRIQQSRRGSDAATLAVSNSDVDDVTVAGFDLYGTNSAYSRTTGIMAAVAARPTTASPSGVEPTGGSSRTASSTT